MSDSSMVDFRNPEAFFHDVNSVAGLLKQFFREMPDPLLTTEHYAGFIEAASKSINLPVKCSIVQTKSNLRQESMMTLSDETHCTPS